MPVVQPVGLLSMSYGLVIFDNDGVLVDSEPIALQILADYLTELGHETSYEDSRRDYMGAALHRIHDLVWERTGRKLPADFESVFHARLFRAFQDRLQPVAGVAGVLEQLTSSQVPFCLASSGHHERIRVALGRTGLDRYFDDKRVFSAQDVGRGKPAPDLFLHAAASMGVPPDECLVVEDSPLGVQAGVAAGMDVYGFAAMTPPAQLAGARLVFREMSQLPGLLP